MTRKNMAAALALVALLAGTAVAADPAPTKTAPLMKDFMGLNTHTVQFEPKLYRPVCRLARDYHPVGWDLYAEDRVDTSVDTTFPMSRHDITWEDTTGKVGTHKGLVDWKKVYGRWIAGGFEVDACIQFGDLTVDKWKDVEADAYQYGKAFAKYFGPSGEALVTSAEIGNEPAGMNKFTPDQYLRIFTSMARGLREGDPKLKILTATTQAGRADGWSMPTEIFAPHRDLYDVLNVHIYSFVEGTRRRSFPEDPSIEYLKIVKRTMDWRDANAPEKELWITEFGYDASTQTPTTNPANWIDVSDEVQAQWLVRSFLEFARMGVQRAYLYFWNDADEPAFHAASGIMRNNEPKMSFWALKQMQDMLGEYRFSRAIKQDAGELYVYEFVNGTNPKDVVWVAWLPTGATDTAGTNPSREVTLEVPAKPASAEAMATADGAPKAAQFEYADGKITITVSEAPTYLKMKLE